MKRMPARRHMRDHWCKYTALTIATVTLYARWRRQQALEDISDQLDDIQCMLRELLADQVIARGREQREGKRCSSS